MATAAPGLGPEEVERFVTVPLEFGLTGIPGVTEMRSLNRNGLSLITVVFRDDVDTCFARQLVLERLIEVRGNLPEGVVPALVPVSSGLVEDEDITRQISPSLEPVDDLLMRRAKPALTTLRDYLLGRYPRCTRLARWLLREKIDKMTYQYFFLATPGTRRYRTNRGLTASDLPPMHLNLIDARVAMTTTLASVLWLVSAAAGAGDTYLPDTASIPTLAPLVEAVKPAVVSVLTTRKVAVRGAVQRPDADGVPAPGTVVNIGSGVVLDARIGHVLTSAENVVGAIEIVALLLDGRHFPAQVVGIDTVTDLAVLKIDAIGLSAIRFGDSDRLRVGDYVLAIGNAFGLGKSITAGIVSGLGRTVSQNGALGDHIQTDAAINPGNAGGALVDLRGELVGIIAGSLSMLPANIGIGFALPGNIAQGVAAQLIEHGAMHRARLGVTAQDVTPDIVAALSLHTTRGALIVDTIQDGAAARAGLRRGDVVLAVDGSPVRSSAQMRNRVGLVRVGQRVTLTVLRGERQLTIDIELMAPLPNEQAPGVGPTARERIDT